ncbi:LacI family DNA-binding transcriptional regulator [Rhizobium sp. TRM95796]|uniref:LacI family DNA-binding transcriptional regulator n=1 Tax=Rhizobium sp. TRM95796 TaxID=2979862 RepID=UPI0021E70B46|nr:LacI family DNA-binding transcriptional regulator [Rhizobium sp. TRM95796]MCV3769039.1 LacI family transcriptional regulator [Rhizobium sp. TRM95796]
MEEFSRFVGLSRPTVSKYFHDPASVRMTTRVKIEAAIARCGYKPNLLAVNLNRRRSNILGVIIPNALDPFFMALARRIEQVAAEAGFVAFILSSDGRTEKQEEAIATLSSMNVAGAIVAPTGHGASGRALEKLRRAIPVVHVDAPPDKDAAFVGTDNRKSFALIVDYLCRSGEPPAFFGMPPVNHNAADRRDAYVEAMSAQGHRPDIVELSAHSTWDFEEFGFEQATAFFEQQAPRSRTLVCANDRIAFGVLAAAWRRGLKIGHGEGCDLRIAGHDDHPLSRYACPPLTTVAQDYAQIGSLAMALLLRKLGETEGDDPRLARDRILLEAALMLRNSA